MKFFAHLPRSLRTSVIGLDISDRTFKYVKLNKERGGYTVDFYGHGEIPKGVIVSGEIQDTNQLSQVLKKAFSVRNARNLPIALSLPEEKGFIQFMELPRIAEKEIQNAIALQLEENIPLPVGDVVFDYEVAATSADRQHLDVVVSVFPKTLLESYIQSLKDAWLKPVLAEPESQALARVVIPQNNKVSVMVVDIGQTRTSFFIAHGNTVRFTSTVNFSGQQLQETLAKTRGISLPEAEKLVKKFSFFQKGNKQVYDALMPVINVLKEELQKRIAYWEAHEISESETHAATPIKKVYLSGGESHMFGLPEYLSSVLDIPVERARPWENIFNLDTYIPPLSAHDALLYATAFGLALRNEE